MAIVFNSETTATLNENNQANTVVYTASAQFDAGETGTITYSLADGSDPALTIDPATGEVSVSESADYEQKTRYQFTVVATDGVSLSTEINVNLNVVNVDEVAPAFISDSEKTALDGRTLVYKAVAKDSSDTSAGVTYSLKAGVGDEALLSIDPANGDVVLRTGVVDSNTKASYTFTVIADDGVNAVTEQSVTVSAESNDGDNVIVASSSAETIDGGAGYNTLVLQGAEYHYIIARQTDGSFTVTPIVNTPFESDGVQTVHNVQLIKFLGSKSERIIDDVSSEQSSTNQVLNFGDTHAGQTFLSDEDWFKVTGGQANQAVHIGLTGGASNITRVTDAEGGFSLNAAFWPSNIVSTTLDENGEKAIKVYNTTSPINAIDPYRVTVYRDKIGTDSNDTLTAGADYEYIDAGAGDDEVVGSDRDSYILGGLGDDTITIGSGSNVVEGGDEKFDTDIVVINGAISDYKISFNDSSDPTPAEGNWWFVENIATGVKSYFQGVEILRFDDQDFVIDDYDQLDGADIAGLSTYAGMGEIIEGRTSLSNDSDWIPFNFGWDVVDRNSSIRISLANIGAASSRSLKIVNATGFALQFELDDGSLVQSLNFGQDYVVKGLQWGTNAEGGAFGGGQAFLVVEGQGYWYSSYGFDGSTGYLTSSVLDAGKYAISISRYAEGTSGDDVLTTVPDVSTPQTSVEEIAGLAGNDKITGSNAAEKFDGGTGDDTIYAGGGDDAITGGAGVDLLYGQEGDDTFTVTGESATSDTFDGGAGIDTVKVSSAVDFSGATFTSIEKLEGTGNDTVTLTEAQINSLSSVSGVVLQGGNTDFSSLSGNYTVNTTTGDDTIITGSGNNTILMKAGADQVNAGAGNDTFSWTASDWEYLKNSVSGSYDRADYTLKLTDSLNGGDGIDTLLFNFNAEYARTNYVLGGNYLRDFVQAGKTYSLDLTGATLSNIESINIVSGTTSSNGVSYSLGPASVYLTAQQFAAINSYSGTNFVVTGGGNVDLTGKTFANGATLSFEGDDAFTVTTQAADDVVTTHGGNDSVTTGAGADQIDTGLGLDTVDAGEGDDTITISVKSSVSDSIDGGAGVDTLVITGGSVDISSATLQNLEKLKANSTSLALTQSQFDSFAGEISGTAGLILKMEQAGTANVADLNASFVGIRGTAGDDLINGSDGNDLLVGDAGDDTLLGGAGNDRLVTNGGVDTVDGGAGDDIVEVIKTTSADTLRGGEGNDTLLLSDGQDLRNAGISGFETLKGTGTVYMTSAQLADVTTVNGLSIILVDQDSEYQIDSLNLINNAAILPQRYLGTSGDDSLTQGAGNQTLIGGAGNDTIDGGSGYNTYEVAGSPDAFIWQVLDDGSIQLIDLIVSDSDAVNGSDEGTDSLRNIQVISFRNPVDNSVINIEVDDFSNSVDPGNKLLGFGELISGRFNFKDDYDYFRFSANQGDTIAIESLVSNSPNYLYIRPESSNLGYFYQDGQIRTFTSAFDGEQALYVDHFNTNPGNSSSPAGTQAYGFVMRREYQDGNDGNLIVADDKYEQILGRGGDDTIIGSDRMDRLLGGEGDDTLTGGLGDDQIFGDGGSANVAIFSGNRADYTLEWDESVRNDRQLGLIVTDKVEGRDGTDTLRNIQVLRFADQDLVLDAEANTSNLDGYTLGQTIEGTMPIAQRFNYALDQDYFQQVLTPDVNVNTSIRVSFEASSELYPSDGLLLGFFANGSTDQLQFTNVETGVTHTSFKVWPGQANEWFVSPTQFYSGAAFAAAHQRLDVKVWAGSNFYNSTAEVGDLASYKVKVDLVHIGDDTAETIDGSTKITYIDAKGGDDIINGVEIAEEIQGGAGNDAIDGGAGDDLIVDGVGANTLSGGAGNDTIDVSASTAPTATIDGGEGVDTLRIASYTDLSGLTLQNMEVLDAVSGTLTITPETLEALGLSTVNNAQFNTGSIVDYNDDFDASALAGNYSVRGVASAETISVGSGDNTVYAGNGDTVIANAGNDTISFDIDGLTSLTGSVSGGEGVDTLKLKKVSTGNQSVDISTLSITGIEHVSGANLYKQPLDELTITTAQVSDLSSISGFSQVTIVGGGTIDLAHFASVGLANGTWRIGDDLSYTVSGTVNGDTYTITGGTLNASLGLGDDTFVVDGVSKVSGQLDGGEGNDTLSIVSGDVDLSGVTLANIEAIDVSSKSLSMLQSQWDTYGSIINVDSDADTSFTLSMDGAGSFTLASDSLYQGLSGSVGADNLTGNEFDNVISGNDGNDVLTGGAGNDRLIAGLGTDNLSGGVGNDTLDVRGKAVVSDRLSGGSGIDTLLVEDGQSLSGAVISDIEKLKGTGTVSLYLAQLAGFTSIDGLTVQLLDDATSVALPANMTLVNGATVKLLDSDAEISTNAGVIGSASDDKITGSDGADVIYGGRGADTLIGGAGNDILDGGKGVSTLIGGAGDDTLKIGGANYNLATSLSGDLLDGGEGYDTVSLDFANTRATYNFLTGSLQNIESLEILNSAWIGNRKNISIYADAWNNLDTFAIKNTSNTTNWNYHPSLYITSDNRSDIDFAAANNQKLNSITLAGQFGDVDLTYNPTSWLSNYNNIDSVFVSVSDIDSLIGSNDIDQIRVSDSNFIANLGAGDDHIKYVSSAAITATIDGGEGNDTVDFSASGLIDLTGLTLNSVETVYYGSARLIVTATQYADWNFDGTGAIYVNDNGIIQGTSGNDSFSAKYDVDFAGGAGNDSVTNVKTFILSGNQNEYDITRSGSTLTIEHARGEMSDGTDTLRDVQFLRFADTPAGQDVQFDDAPGNVNLFYGANQSNWSDLTQLEYGKRVSISQDYASDMDVFGMTLVPNSPIFIDASTPNGNIVYFYMYDAETGSQLRFKSLVYGNSYPYYRSDFSADWKWLPEINTADGWQPYEGGDVVVSVADSGSQIEDVAFTINYLDDYAGSVDTLGQMDPMDGVVKGYVGDWNDEDWIRTDLIAGTKYEFRLSGDSSGGGTLADPKLELRDSEGRLIEVGVGAPNDLAGTDDGIIFRPTESGSYYLAVSDVAGIEKGSWTLSQESLDTIAGNTSTTERIEWSLGNTFKVESEINQLTDHDWFKVWLDKGVTYEFNMDGITLGGSLQDPQLMLRSVTGILLDQDDNSGTGSDAQLIYTAPDSGWYYLDAGASGNASKGTYSIRGSSLQDDFDDTVLTEGQASLDVPVHGLISYLGDSDWLKVGLSAGRTYVISLAGDISDEAQLDPLVDPILRIRDANGAILQVADDFGSTLDAKAYFTPDTDGLYFLEASSAFRFDIGAYQLDVTLAPPDDHGSLLDETATSLTLDTNNTVQISGSVGIPGDKDVFSYLFEANKVYQIGLSGKSGKKGTLVDPIVRVFDANGNLVDWDNNGGLGNDASFYFIPPTAGQFYVEVAAKDNRSMGTYQLDIAERNLPADDAGNDIGTSNVLTPGDEFQGNLLTHNDQDWFAINLEAGENYVFRAKASHSGNGSLEDPVLELRAADGTLIKSADNMLTTNEPAFPYTPAASGKFYLVVKAANGAEDTGSYTLITRAPDDHGSTKASATEISLDETLNGGIQWNDGEFGVRAYDSVGLANDFDEDWFKFTATDGQILTFSAQLADGSSLSRPLVEVVDSAGRTLAVGDGLETNNGLASATFKANGAGTYYARLIDGAGATGNYTVSLTEGDASDEDSDGPVSMSFTSNGDITLSEAKGVIGLSGDTDDYEVSLQAGHSYRIETVAVRDGTIAPLPSADLEMVWKPTNSGTQVDGVSGQWTANDDGTYTLAVFVSDAIKASWSEGVEAIDATIGFDAEVLGTIDSITFASGAMGVANTSTAGEIGLGAVFFPASYDVDGSNAIVEITFSDVMGDPTQSTLSFSDIVFNESRIEPIAQEGTPSFFSEGAITADQDGTLSIKVSPLEETQTGQYMLRVVDLGTSVEDDFVDSAADFDEATHGVLAINESISGKIDPQNDKDLVAVNLTAGNIYDFSVKSFYDGLGTLSKSTLRLLDANGNLVSVGSEDSDTGRTEMAISVFESGRYFLEVSAPDIAGNTGTYVLDTRLRGDSAAIEDDISSDTQSAVVAGPGQPATGKIDYAGDHDWIRVNLEADKVYVFDVLADGDGAGGTLTDSTLRLLDSEGDQIAFDDNSGAGKDSHIQFAARYSGDYYLDVSSVGLALGTYTVRVRELYSGIADPLASAQWYLDAAGVAELDNRYSGAGISVGVIDDGFDTAHPDLQENIDFATSFDTQFDTQDGKHKYPVLPGPPDFHGTPVAGIIGATANNETGIRGVAYDTELSSTRVKWTWDQITQALGQQWQFDVSNNSWGAISPFSDNFNNTNLTFAWMNIRKGIEDGRDGLGTNFVFSAGNSAGSGDNTNYHNFQNAREVITVGAANQDGSAAAFSTPGASVLVSSYGVDLMTTDRLGGLGINKGSDYTSFTGTSAAAPLVSGIVALMLEANPNLGYRDVQKILAYSATHPEVQDWKTNGASNLNLGGLQYNDKAGFGLVDAYAAVQLAKTWTTTNTSVNEATASARKFGMIEAIPDGTGSSFTMQFEIESSMTVEHVELGVDLRHERMGDVIITLTSPDGTVSTLMDRATVNAERPFGLSGTDSGVPTHLLWDFSSVQFWGEDATGTWTINVQDVRAEKTGTVQSLSLRIYGEQDGGDDVYVFTDEGFQRSEGGLLEDEFGKDTINAAPVRFDMYIDLYEGIIAANATTHGIADWTLVENATSGSGNDRLVGNDEDNLLNAGDGKDILEGGLGNDTLIGGAGSDTAVYSGNRDEYTMSWDPDTKTLTIVDIKTSNGDEGTDILTGIERVVFADAEVSLSAEVGNRAPVANTTFFDSPVFLKSGMGIDYQLPDNVFTDPDGEATSEMTIVVSDASGGEMPGWLSYDEDTGTFTGVPPEDYQGQLKLKVEAIDEFGESVSDILTMQFGDNQAPVLEAAKEIVIDEDAGLVPLSITLPFDPEETDVSIEILSLPTQGALLDKNGNQLSVGTTLSADELTEVHFKSLQDANGDGGYFRYKATDGDGVTAESSVHLFITPVNDAPRFTTESSTLVMNYPEQTSVPLDIQHPTDPESVITNVRITELPEVGVVTLDGEAIQVGNVLVFDQLDRLVYTLSENINGPVGGLGIQAVDEQGAATNWTLNIEVSGEASFSQGTAGNDELYGSIAGDTLYGQAGNDLLVGNGGDDRLLAGLGNDTLLGGSGNDTLDGSAGNDYLDGGAGNDIMAGGPGQDTYVVDSTSDLILEVIGGGAGGNDLVVTSVSMTAPTNVENLQAADGEVVDLTGNNLDNTLLGNDESNVLRGEAGRDYLLGEGGDDTLDGGSGVDTLAGGVGNDEYYVDSRADRIVETALAGIDRVFATSSYTLASNIENLTLLGTGDFTAGGNSLDNHIVGNSGNNVIAGGLGTDTLEGGLGDDIYILNDNNDTIVDTGGNDTIRSSLDVELVADIENIELVGIADTVAQGNGLDNNIKGNMGHNILEGAGGVDTLTGGLGADQFVIAFNGEGLQADLITDFTHGEDLLVIDLASFGIDAEAAGIMSSGLISEDSFVTGAGAVALDANDYFIFDTAQGVLKFDADGSGQNSDGIIIARIQEDKYSQPFSYSDGYVGI